MSDVLADIVSNLRSIYGGGRRWIIATEVLVGAGGMVSWLEQLGAESALVIASAPGTGDPPNPDFAPNPIVFDVVSATMMEAIRQSSELLANLPIEAVARVDAYDPGHELRVLGTIFDDGRPVAGRAKYAARPIAWQQLEDKTTVDELWDAIGVTRASSEIAAAHDLAELEAASERIDQGSGTVWAADSREGFHGGASFTRHVRTSEDMLKVQGDFAAIADSIRVMPFLEGVPCSIHGIVFDDYVIALRPCEMLVFRRPDGSFHYGRAATFWDPPGTDREQMRTMARDVGAHLREHFSYRGAFTVDGVMTEVGFRPTELNPRFGAALGTIFAALELDGVLLNFAIVEGEDADWRPRELEGLMLEAADRDRRGGTMAVVPVHIAETERVDLAFEDGAFRFAEGGDVVAAKAMRGPHSAGGIVFATFVPEVTPIGASCGPRAAAALAFLDEVWSLGIGPLEPATDARSIRS